MSKPDAQVGDNSKAQIKSFVERIERLEEEKATIAGDIRDVYAEAKGAGLLPKALRQVIRERKQDRAEREALAAIVEEYRAALGDLASLPLGEAAIRRRTA